MRYVLKVLDAISGYSGRLVAFLGLPLVAVIVVGVIARYIFQSPFIWTHEMMEFLSALIFALGGGYVYLHRAHVSVDVIHKLLSTRGRAIMDAVAAIFFFIYASTLAYAGINFGIRSLLMLERAGTPWNPPVYPVKIALGLAFFIILLAGIANFIRDVKTAIKGEEEQPHVEFDAERRDVAG